MDSRKLPWGLVWRDEKLAKRELQKAGKEGRRGLIATWAPSLLQRKYPAHNVELELIAVWMSDTGTQCQTAPYWEKCSFIYMPKGTSSQPWAAGKQPWCGSKRKGTACHVGGGKAGRTGAHQGEYLAGATVEWWNAKVSCKRNREPKVTLEKRSARKQQRKTRTTSSRNIGAFSLKAFMKMACNSVLM